MDALYLQNNGCMPMYRHHEQIEIDVYQQWEVCCFPYCVNKYIFARSQASKLSLQITSIISHLPCPLKQSRIIALMAF